LLFLLLSAQSGFSQTWIWYNLPSLPAPLNGSAYANVDQDIYVIGGVLGATQFNTVWRSSFLYSPWAGTWTSRAAMVTSRSYAAAAGGSNGRLYVFGGYLGGSNVPGTLVEEYNPATDTWTIRAPMPTARARAKAIQLNGMIYVIGGVNAFGVAVNTVEAYNPLTNSWITRAPMSSPRADFGASIINAVVPLNATEAVVAGGRLNLGTTGLSGIERYNSITNTWVPFGNLAFARYGNALAFDAGMQYLYEGGGYINGGFISSTFNVSYSTNVLGWISVNGGGLQMPAPMADFGMFFFLTPTFSGEAVVVGGTGMGNAPLNNYNSTLFWIVLPADQLQFSAAQEQDNVLLNWELDPAEASAFRVERSADGTQFEAISEWLPARSTAEYAFIDRVPMQGKNYYRLQMDHPEGNQRMSEVVAVEFDLSEIGAVLLQDSDQQRVELRYTLPGAEHTATLSLVAIDGKEVFRHKIDQQSGNVLLPTNGLASGLYLCRLKTASGVRVLKLLLD
jgi:hypothetical protein